MSRPRAERTGLKPPAFVDEGVNLLLQVMVEWAGGILRLKDDTGGVPFRSFRFGTCHGLWRDVPDAVEILAVENGRKGNGHFALLVRELGRRAGGRLVRFRMMVNGRLTRHLCGRWGFAERGEDCEGKV